MNPLQSPIAHLLQTHSYNEKVVKILSLIVEDKMNSLARDEKLAEMGIRRISDIKEYTPDIVLDYIDYCLEDNAISDDEFRNAKLLKIFLGISEGDFVKNHREKRMKEIISKQISLVFADNKVDYEEILHMESIQGLFDLSYNQFECIIHEIV